MKSLDIRKVSASQYEIYAIRDDKEVPVRMADDGNGVSLDRRELGERVKKGYQAPTGPIAQMTKEQAINLAHQIGRYLFGFGDLVFGYTTVEGRYHPSFFDE